MPTVCNLLVASLTVASVCANASLKSETLNQNDPSSSLRHLSGATGSCTGRVTGWELIDTKTNAKVTDLANGTIVYSENPSFSIRAVVTGTGTRSVSLTLNSGYTNTENTAPYALCTNLGETYRRCNGLVHGKHTVTGTACCDRNGRGICQRPPTTLAFEIRSPAPTKPPTKAPVTKAPKAPTKPPTKAPTKPPTKTPTKAPTKAPMKVCTVPGYDGDRDGCCGAGVLAADSIGFCCQPGEIVRFDPTVQTVSFFDKCCPQETAVLIGITGIYAGQPGVCCPAGTALVGFSVVDFDVECCKPDDILVPNLIFGVDFCCPKKTIAVAFDFKAGLALCCPPSTGVNPVTNLCCSDGQMECTPKPSSSCAVIGNDGDGDSCCGANVTAVSSKYECCEPGQIVAFMNKTGEDVCCPPGTTGVNSDGVCCPANNTLVKNVWESRGSLDAICCPAGTTVTDSSEQCCTPDDIVVPFGSYGDARCCPNSTLAVGTKNFALVCCPPSTGVNPVTKKCCADGEKECTPKPSLSCAVIGNDGDGDACCNKTGVLAATSDFYCCEPGQIVSFSNPIGNQPRREYCCPAGQLVVNSVGNCCANTTILTKLPDQTEKCCPIGTTLADINRKCCKPGEILSPFLQPGSPAVYCCPAGTNVSAYNAIFTPSCCPPNTGANLITEKCCPAGQMTC
jgi:hypothetical protein